MYKRQALDLPLALHPEAEQAIALRTAEMAAKGQGTADMSAPENQQRLQMGCLLYTSRCV